MVPLSHEVVAGVINISLYKTVSSGIRQRYSHSTRNLSECTFMDAKRAIFINYLLQCNKAMLGFETFIKAVDFLFFFAAECFTKTELLAFSLLKAMKDRVGIR